MSRIALLLALAACTTSTKEVEPGDTATASEPTQASPGTTTATRTGTSPTGSTGTSTPTGTGTTGGTGSSTGGTTTDTATSGTGTGSSTTEPPPEPVTWDLGDEVVCADPSRRAESIWDVQELGSHDVLHVYHWAGGVTLHDFDRDGALELIRTTETGLILYEQSPDGWVDVTAARVPELPPLMVAGATGADIDGDDDIDLVLSPWLGRVHVLRNDGTGHFEDFTGEAGLHTEPFRHQTSTLGDLDGDGDLDLFVGAYGDVPPQDPEVLVNPSRLYLNRGDGTFDDGTATLPDQVHGGYTFQGAFVDADLDIDQDLLVLNDFTYHEPNLFLLNDGGPGLENDPAAAFAPGVAGMGLEIGELNGDGLPDYLISGFQEVAVLLSTLLPDGGVTFIRTDASWGLHPDPTNPVYQEFAWGVQLGDLDNNGSEEIFAAFGDATDPLQFAGGRLHWRDQLDILWTEVEPGVWEDSAESWDLRHPGVNRGALFVDWNDDGWLDMILAELKGPTIIRTARCGEERWSKVRLHDERTANRDAIGATVEVIGPTRSWKEWVTAGATSMYSDGPHERHFGLGDLLAVDIEVVWPDGERSRLEGVPTNRTVTVTRH